MESEGEQRNMTAFTLNPRFPLETYPERSALSANASPITILENLMNKKTERERSYYLGFSIKDFGV